MQYLTGSNLNLTCMVTPTPPPSSTFRWTCSTGCFADLETQQSIYVTDLNAAENGLISCSVTIDELILYSDPLNFQITGQWK